MIDDELSARAWLESLPEWDALARDRLERLIALLRKENTAQNLVAAASLEHVWQRHIADSAQLLRFVARGTDAPWLDLGTGAGFPGVVVAVLRPELQVMLVESRPRRAAWLERARLALGLERAKVLGSPLEKIDSGPVAVISARAFAPLDRLLKLSAPFSTVETLWLLPKGRSAAQELEELKGWRHVFHVEHSLTDPQAGLIVGQLHGKARRS